MTAVVRRALSQGGRAAKGERGGGGEGTEEILVHACVLLLISFDVAPRYASPLSGA
jgi:hypothetical protein